MEKQRRRISNQDRYLIWATTRSVLETEMHKNKAEGKKMSFWSLFTWLVFRFADLLKAFGLYELGMKNARNISLKRQSFKAHHLPESFRGYRILHLTDMHIDSLDHFEDDIISSLPEEEVDLCVITGDFRASNHGEYLHLLPRIRKITDAIRTKDGIYAVLGNHDPYQLTEHEEEMGLQFLVNESIKIERGGEEVTVTGTDDPFRYFTDQSIEAIAEAQGDCKIALVHTAELGEIASRHGYSLYFCGHTHGGQVCLPGGKAIITHQSLDPTLAEGNWNIGELSGYTSRGCGVSGIPVRFFCKPEVVLSELYPMKETYKESKNANINTVVTDVENS